MNAAARDLAAFATVGFAVLVGVAWLVVQADRWWDRRRFGRKRLR